MPDPRGEPLWHWPELCAALQLPVADGPDITGISIDSRTVRPGELFVALPGDPGPRFNPSRRSQRDGHDFIAHALAAGAAGVLSHDPVVRDCPELKVADTLDGLWALGRAGRARLDCPVVAVTGSSGKTTTKALLAAALGAFATAGSLNNHLGVPLSLARTPRHAAAAVYEIGTNQEGEIGPLSELVRPGVAVLLNVHRAHLENFPDRDALFREKFSIVNGLLGKTNLIIEDTLPLGPVPAGVSILRFGRTEKADVRLLGATDDGVVFRLPDGRRLAARVPGGGEHRALSLAAAVAVLLALERDPATALDLPDDLLPAGRGDRRSAGGITLIDDSYNANPESVAAALKSLAALPGRRFALLGEMLELGAGAAAAHADLAPLCQDLDGVLLTGAGMAPLADALPDAEFFREPDEALLARLRTLLAPGDTLLVKGSNRVFWVRGYVDRILAALTS